MKRSAGISIIIAAAVVAGTALSMTGCIKIVREGGPASGGLEVPVNANGASNVGSLEFELVYDSTALQAVGVEKGTLAGNAMMDFTTARPGRVWVGIVDSNGINGNGSLVVVSFQGVGEGAATGQLTLENVEAYDAQTLIDIITQTTPGNLSTPPAISFTP